MNLGEWNTPPFGVPQATPAVPSMAEKLIDVLYALVLNDALSARAQIGISMPAQAQQAVAAFHDFSELPHEGESLDDLVSEIGQTAQVAKSPIPMYGRSIYGTNRFDLGSSDENIITAVDNLTLTAKDQNIGASAKQALESTIKKMLEQACLERFEPKIGAKYNPVLCRAMSSKLVSFKGAYEGPQNTVVEVLRCGYKRRNQLLRAADVVVSKAVGIASKEETSDLAQKLNEEEKKLWSETQNPDAPPPSAP